MSISTELEAAILRYYHVEKWPINTIRHYLKVHPSVVQRVLSQEGISVTKILKGGSRIDPFLPFILETLQKYPGLTAARLYDMIYERGHRGNKRHFRHWLRLHRPRPHAEAYLRLKTIMGEQLQIDWGSFGHVTIGRAKRPLIAFVMVLSFSRKIFLKFYLNQRMSNFLDGHESAFKAFGGVARVALYDNLKSLVLERRGDAIRFNETLLAFASHYHYEPRPVAVARGNEKGRVERSIRYIRDNFFAGRTWTDLDDLNAQALVWCEGPAADRPCPEDCSRTVRELYEEERHMLLCLPDNLFPTADREAVRVGKTPYCRFDLNDYSIPHTHVRRTLTVLATTTKVQIVDGTTLLAEHLRCFDKGKQIENKAHVQALVDAKRKASQHTAQDRLGVSVPSSMEFLKQSLERGSPLRSTVRDLMLLLDAYGATELEMAMIEALDHQMPHPNAVRLSLDRRRELLQCSVSIRADLPSDPRVRDSVVRPHKLETYDQLGLSTEETT